MPIPTITIFLDRLEENARAVTTACKASGIEVFGVSKAACGSPLVARAMLKGGVAGIGESRLDNIMRLRRNGITCPMMLLRIPAITEAPEVVKWCTLSLNSEGAALRALSRAAVEAGVEHEVMVMVEMGDRREGVPPDELGPLCELAAGLPGLALAGIGANFMCASGVLPSIAKLERLSRLAEAVEARCGFALRHVSGGNSSSLHLLRQGGLPAGINQLRIGCSLLLGEDPWTGETLPGLRADGFLLEAELIEIKLKHSLPDGELGLDAFGNRLSFTDRGERVRGICNLGRLDMNPAGLRPHDPGVEIVTASSDHLILDLTEGPDFCVGDAIRFELDYGSLVQAMLSPYVTKDVEAGMPGPIPRGVCLIAAEEMLALEASRAFLAEMEELGFTVAARPGGSAEDCREAVLAGLEGEEIPVLVGAEIHSLTPFFGALRQASRDLGLLWMNAYPHCDPAEGGLLAEALTAAPADAGLAALAEGSALVGLCAASRAEVAFIRDNDLLALTMEDVDLLGIREATRRALERVRGLGAGFALAFDASVVRGMGHGGEDTGLSYRETSLAMEMTAAAGGLRTVAMTGFSPDAPAAHLQRAYGYLLSAFGRRILGR